MENIIKADENVECELNYDTEGPIEVASRWGQRGEDRKRDLIEMEKKV